MAKIPRGIPPSLDGLCSATDNPYCGAQHCKTCQNTRPSGIIAGMKSLRYKVRSHEIRDMIAPYIDEYGWVKLAKDTGVTPQKMSFWRHGRQDIRVSELELMLKRLRLRWTIAILPGPAHPIIRTKLDDPNDTKALGNPGRKRPAK